jgi:hypothetical protein
MKANYFLGTRALPNRQIKGTGVVNLPLIQNTLLKPHNIKSPPSGGLNI